ncbi:hypothetical protein CRE_22490 [Caenorhabditis remanei]|uniref:DUF38 domain-containing protein n=1 Tax=Caenorhabditis remanei TaxID=31234 RepID=E3MU18_CAERE|nr:hypothetical protein CRE_22490 [Caenorhabditis remanei]
MFSFPFLKLPFLAIQNTVRNLSCIEIKCIEPYFMIDGTHEPETVMKALVDHLKDVFKLPLEVNFKPYKMENFFRFLPVFPICKRFYFHATEGVSEEELKYVKDNVVVEQRAYYYTSS